ncbi:hypothetical protein [Ammoniphilus resinae]|nr:hypothetical protein [Ammoniphilus resinae]
MLDLMQQRTEVETIMEKVESYLREHYLDEDVDSSNGVWGEFNSVHVTHLSTFFDDLKGEGILPNNSLFVHYTASDDENTFDCMATRFVLFDGTLPLFSIAFDEVIGSRGRRLEGLLKEGFQQIIEAVVGYTYQPAKSLVVDYTIIAGETQVTKTHLLESDDNCIDPKELIQAYFSDFWGENTDCKVHASSFNRKDGCEAVKINSYREVSAMEANVLRKYI